MGDLSVMVRLNGQVVEDRVLLAPRVARLGEAPDADVPFPGADITVVRVGRGLSLRGRTLEEGEELEISLGPVELHVEHTVRRPVPSELAGRFDRRFLMVVALVTVVGSWLEAVESWAEDNLHHVAPDGVVAGLYEALGSAAVEEDDARRAAAVTGRDRSSLVEPPVARALGPRHRPDDVLTGTGWYRWYRSAVPADSEQLDAALARYLRDASDADARRLLGRAAYDADDPEEALRQFEWLVQHHPSDRDARLRLARAAMRLGRHDVEIDNYHAILDEEPKHVTARAGSAVALARLDRLDAAAVHLDELSLVAPDHVSTHLARAKVAALEGRDGEALDSLEAAYAARASLSAEGQLELRRDMALDPAFARLRGDLRMRSLVTRHVGAAGPRLSR